MATFFKIWIVFFFLKQTYAGNAVDVITSAGLNALEDEEILRVLSRNDTGTGNNFTLVEIIGGLGNRTLETGTDRRMIQKLEDRHTNPFYDDYAIEIDRDAKRLLQIIPAYDPGAGQVSPECKRHAAIFHNELAKFTLWALKMYDATAKMPSGLLNGNVNQFGDFDECIGIRGSDGIQGQYCLAHLQLTIHESRLDLKRLHRLLHSHYAFRSNVTDPGHRVPRFSTVNWAVCTPASCTPEDVETSIRDTLARHTMHTGLEATVVVNREMCQVKGDQSIPLETKLVSSLFVAVFALTIVAAYLDHYRQTTNPILVSFSLKRNLHKLLSLERNETDISTLHGIRAINAVMLLLSHKSLAVFFNPYTNRTEMAENLGKPWTVISRASSLYTDPFIMMSALLTTYSFVGKLKRTGSLDIRNEYTLRLVRLVPSLAALILFCTYVAPYAGSGPQWNLVVTEHANICKRTWWRNFLFIHNYFGFENMCLTHTHQLGIDTQLFVFSPLMVILLYKRPKAGSIILIAFASLSTALRYFVTYYRQLNNYVYYGTSIRQLFDTANYSYTLPLHRLTVYIIGVFIGYLLRQLPRDYTINKVALRVGWILSTIMFCAAFFGPSHMGSINYVYNPRDAAMYNAFAPIGWCSLLAWVTLLSHTGNTNGLLGQFLSWRGFLVVTRLSYAIYLTQFPIYFYNVGKTRSAEHFQFTRHLFDLNELFWIVALSVVLTLTIDMPSQNIGQRLRKSSETTPKPKKLAKLQ